MTHGLLRRYSVEVVLFGSIGSLVAFVMFFPLPGPALDTICQAFTKGAQSDQRGAVLAFMAAGQAPIERLDSRDLRLDNLACTVTVLRDSSEFRRSCAAISAPHGLEVSRGPQARIETRQALLRAERRCLVEMRAELDSKTK